MLYICTQYDIDHSVSLFMVYTLVGVHFKNTKTLFFIRFLSISPLQNQTASSAEPLLPLKQNPPSTLIPGNHSDHYSRPRLFWNSRLPLKPYEIITATTFWLTPLLPTLPLLSCRLISGVSRLSENPALGTSARWVLEASSNNSMLEKVISWMLFEVNDALCVFSPLWCVITGCIGEGKKANVNNVGKWVRFSLLTNSWTVSWKSYGSSDVVVYRASSRSLRSTVRTSWPSAAPGANRLWVFGKALSYIILQMSVIWICLYVPLEYHNKVSCFMLQQIEEACPIGAHAALIVPPTWIIRVRRQVTLTLIYTLIWYNYIYISIHKEDPEVA